MRWITFGTREKTFLASPIGGTSCRMSFCDSITNAQPSTKFSVNQTSSTNFFLKAQTLSALGAFKSTVHIYLLTANWTHELTFEHFTKFFWDPFSLQHCRYATCAEFNVHFTLSATCLDLSEQLHVLVGNFESQIPRAI